jgi:hypothetical protein
MPSLARGEENTTGKVNWFITINGALTDMFEVGFRIFDITAGLPGTQIFPTTPGDYETVTNAPGKFSVGSYYAYDNTAGNGWTPELTASIGTHRIEWRWKVTAGSPYQAGQEDFEVLVESAGGTTDYYATIQDIRDEGVTVAMADDTTVQTQLAIWHEFIDRACRQWFQARALTLVVDGNDSDLMPLGVPIISLDYLKLNGDTAELDPDYYRVYSSRSWPDDRRNPRIQLRGREEFRDIYTAPLAAGTMRFRRGYQNQELKGTFGFLEPDGSTPKLINRALVKLVIEKLKNPIFTDPASGSGPLGPVTPPILGPLLSERTDDHERRYGAGAGGDSAFKSRKNGLAGITSDPEILDIIRLYRAPLGVATPAHWSYT